MIGRLIRFVVLMFAGTVVVAIPAIAVMMIWSRGHAGILIRSNEGRFAADSGIPDEMLKRNLIAVGFHRCDYFTGLSVFTTLEGPSCPWYMSDGLAVSNVRTRID